MKAHASSAPCSVLSDPARLPAAGDVQRVIDRYERDARAGDRERARQRGLVYTPDKLADYLAQRVVTGAGEAPQRVLDPACGAGRLLVRVYQRMVDESQLLDQRVQALRAIHGVDVDEHAVALARQVLVRIALPEELLAEAGADAPHWLAAARAIVQQRIRTAHSLDADFSQLFADMPAGGFDAIIANPPYGSYTGRQAIGGSVAPSASNGPARGWPSVHGRFIELALRLAHRENARIAMIVPGQVGHLQGYAPLRRLLAEAGLREVRYWGERVFAGVSTPVLTFVAQRGYRGHTHLQAEQGSAQHLDLRNGRIWRGDADADRAKLLARVCQRSFTLGRAVGDPGVHTGNCARKLIVPGGRCGQSGVEPVLEGRCITRYACAVPQRGLETRYTAGDGQYFRIARPEVYARARFVVRQTAGRPIVGPRDHAVYFRNSLLALLDPADEQPGVDVRYVVGILNSRLMGWVYRQMVMEAAQRTFPQVKVGSLRKLPMRRVGPGAACRADHDRLVVLVERMLRLHRLSRAMQDQPRWRRLVRAVDARIEAQVYKVYEVNPREIALIERDLDSAPCPGSNRSSPGAQ